MTNNQPLDKMETIVIGKCYNCKLGKQRLYRNVARKEAFICNYCLWKEVIKKHPKWAKKRTHEFTLNKIAEYAP